MNIFENLVEELKEENLLENTFGESNTDSNKKNSNSPKSDAADILEATELYSVAEQELEQLEHSKDKADEGFDEKDFFKQRAIDEVGGLQMVEHVIAGIEREQLKTASSSYNDIRVKQSLHNFLKIEDVKSPEHAQSEFQLMQETEDWYSSLSRRDRNILVAQFRRFCEQTKPSLSSRALMALARFYRNSPFSESVRSKFDLVITRLFTKELNNNKREMLFDKDEIIKHLKELYADWSSIPLYSVEDDDSELLLAVLQFQDFVDEVKIVDAFDELIRTDLFKRVKLFKEKTSENFYSPMLVAAAIECNVVIGNKYVELIEKERNSSNLADKYGVLNDEAISEASSKTLELVELLKEKEPLIKTEPTMPQPYTTSAENVSDRQEITEPEISPTSKKTESVKKTSEQSLLKVNKKLLVGMIITLIFGGVFYYTQFNSATVENETALTPGVKNVNIENSFLNNHLNKVRISKSTFFAIAKPTWVKLERGEKDNYLRKIRSLSKEHDFKKIMIIDENGVVLASANDEKINISDKTPAN